MEMVGSVLGSLVFMAAGVMGFAYMWDEEKGKGGKWYECLGAAMISYCFLFLPGFLIAVGKGGGHFWWFEVPEWVLGCVIAPGMIYLAVLSVICWLAFVMWVWDFLVKFFCGDLEKPVYWLIAGVAAFLGVTWVIGHMFGYVAVKMFVAGAVCVLMLMVVVKIVGGDNVHGVKVWLVMAVLVYGLMFLDRLLFGGGD